MKRGFFEKQTDSSRVKAEIVSKYFSGWANVLCSSANKLIYLDLFCGPGRYEDGNPSTPLLILEKAINHWNFDVCKKIHFIFNDADKRNITKLENEIRHFSGINKLKNQPVYYEDEVGDELVNLFENTVKVPTLSFVDPWGYKGLSLRLIKALVKDFGCDGIFFFNYRRINAAIDNVKLRSPMNLLFSEKVLSELQRILKDKAPYQREEIILDKINDLFTDWGMEFILPFCFKSENGKRTTHHLIFVSKHPRGYTIMKDIMAKESSYKTDGVPSFEYISGRQRFNQMSLFSPIEKLKKSLIVDLAGSTYTMVKLFEIHGKNNNFIKSNYKRALLELENDKIILTNRNIRKTRKGTLPDNLEITFPPRKK